MFFTKPLVLVLSVVAVNAVPQLDSIFNTITSDLNSVATQVTGGAGSVVTQVTGGAGSVAGDVTSVANGVIQTVISAGGTAVTVITSVGGDAITLAGSGLSAGQEKVTSFAGAQYTIVSGSAVPPMAKPALFAGLLTVLAGACVGALITV
ncbi:hypothetical protein B0H19DRAFT_1126742 [Mycena capillaripes]|nr:hypothetical protein B0H19DRAFT_1126742 [Mycena capillaripes]